MFHSSGFPKLHCFWATESKHFIRYGQNEPTFRTVAVNPSKILKWIQFIQVVGRVPLWNNHNYRFNKNVRKCALTEIWVSIQIYEMLNYFHSAKNWRFFFCFCHTSVTFQWVIFGMVIVFLARSKAIFFFLFETLYSSNYNINTINANDLLAIFCVCFSFGGFVVFAERPYGFHLFICFSIWFHLLWFDLNNVVFNYGCC